MLYTAFIFGLISSLHCIGMCGPIVMMLPIDKKNQSKKVTQIITYHIGRISAYTSIGLVFGLFGKGLYVAGIQQKLSIIIGILIILILIVPQKKLTAYNLSKPIYKIISKIKTKLGNQFRKQSYTSLFTIGLLNGFLPCGMIYVALFGATAMQSPIYGMLYMMLFGLGTIPIMSSVMIVNQYFTAPIRHKIQKIIPYIGILIGILFIMRGLGLNIPYISPNNTSLWIQKEPTCH